MLVMQFCEVVGALDTTSNANITRGSRMKVWLILHVQACQDGPDPLSIAS